MLRSHLPIERSPFDPPEPMANSLRLDDVATEIAARQHGVVSRAQLLAAGFPARTVDRRVSMGRLLVMHRGVYRVGPIAPPPAAEMAASMACGPHALVAFHNAAWIWKVLSTRSGPVRVILTRGHRRRPGIRIYRLGSVAYDERTVHEGIPVTTPARTLYDLASTLPALALDRAVAEAIALRLVTIDELAAMAKRHHGRGGAGRLEAAIEGGPPARIRSKAEEKFLRLVRRAKVKAPLVNTMVAGHEVDFYWPDECLAVEVDGRPYHSSPRASRRDRRRDGAMVETGIRVLRIAWEDIVDHPEALLVRLGKALAVGRGR
jgi:very-short-patch-repair endonuclease